LLRELAGSLNMDVDKIVKAPERVKFEAEKMQADQQAAMAAQAQLQGEGGGQPQLPAPTNVDEAGNPAGGVDANTMTGVMQ
jgi:hypothetical protein